MDAPVRSNAAKSPADSVSQDDDDPFVRDEIWNVLVCVAGGAITWLLLGQYRQPATLKEWAIVVGASLAMVLLYRKLFPYEADPRRNAVSRAFQSAGEAALLAGLYTFFCTYSLLAAAVVVGLVFILWFPVSWFLNPDAPVTSTV